MLETFKIAVLCTIGHRIEKKQSFLLILCSGKIELNNGGGDAKTTRQVSLYYRDSGSFWIVLTAHRQF